MSVGFERPRAELRRVARVAGFGAVTALMLPAFIVRTAASPLTDSRARRDAWVRAWSDAMLRIFGIEASTRGAAPLHGSGHLVVSNHRSTADILLLLRFFGGLMVSRADVAGWPLVGAAARAVGTVFVDRTDALSGAAAVRTIRSQLTQGSTVILFPEGTTFPDDEVRPFHPGAFVAALHSRTDIVPVGLAYETGSGAAFVDESFPAHLARMAAAAPSRVGMCIGAPIAVGEKARATKLRDEARAEVARLVGEARRMIDG